MRERTYPRFRVRCNLGREKSVHALGYFRASRLLRHLRRFDRPLNGRRHYLRVGLIHVSLGRRVAERRFAQQSVLESVYLEVLHTKMRDCLVVRRGGQESDNVSRSNLG